MQPTTKYAHVLGTALLSVILTAPMPALADKGRFQGHAVLESTQFTEIKTMEGHPMKSAMAGELDGLVFSNGGGSTLDQLLDKAHYHVAWVGDGGGSSYCMKTFTARDGSKLFARCEGKASATGSTGIIILLGGTGAFDGIKGKGKFNFVGVTDRVFWDDVEWNWETP